MLVKQELQLSVTQLALCNKFRPTYVVVRVVAYVYAQLVQQVFVASVSIWVECDFVFHNKYIKSNGADILYSINDENVTELP